MCHSHSDENFMDSIRLRVAPT